MKGEKARVSGVYAKNNYSDGAWVKNLSSVKNRMRLVWVVYRIVKT